jgi:hypothetical protein
MLLPAASGLAPVKAVYAAPLKLPATLAEGMLSLAPSVSATAGLLKYAYSEMLPKMSGNVQLVVIVTGALPVAVPFRTRLKFTSPGAAVMVRPLLSVALRLTAAGLDLICAPALPGKKAKKNPNKTSTDPRHAVRVSLRTRILCGTVNFLSPAAVNELHPITQALVARVPAPERAARPHMLRRAVPVQPC